LAAVACLTLAAVVGGQDKQAFTPKFKNDAGALAPYYQQSTTKVLQVIRVQGQELSQIQESTFFYKWEPLSQTPDGKWIVKQTVEGLRMSIDISGNAVVYDSRQKDATGSASNPGLINFFKNLEGSSFEVTMSKDFKVESVNPRDRDAFLAKLAANNAQMDALLKKIMTDEALKQMVDPTMGLIPDQPQPINGTWLRKNTLSLGPIGTYEVTYNFKYAARNGDLDRVDVTTTLAYFPPKDTTEGLLFKIKAGTLTTPPPKDKDGKPLPPGTPLPPNGHMLYNFKTGRIQHAEVKLDLEGDLTVAIGGSDTNVNLKQTQTTTIDTQDTSYMVPAAAPAPPPKG
jgi:hypothetical protein